MEGVVRAPSEFSMTRQDLPSIIATHEFVVPRSMPQMSARSAAEARRPRAGAAEERPAAAAAARRASGESDERRNIPAGKKRRVFPSSLSTISLAAGEMVRQR